MLKKLQEFKTIIEQFDYTCNIIEKGELTPVDMLLVSLEDDSQAFAISILPLSEDLDGSFFVQFYYEYPFEISPNDYSQIGSNIITVNRQLPLGHFNYTISNQQVYFKYVFALPIKANLEPANIADIVDMVVFAISNFGRFFESKNQE